MVYQYLVSIPLVSPAAMNNGITFGNGSSTINWYSEATLTGTWINVSGTVSSTFKLCRIGSVVFINILSDISPKIIHMLIHVIGFVHVSIIIALAFENGRVRGGKNAWNLLESLVV